MIKFMTRWLIRLLTRRLIELMTMRLTRLLIKLMITSRALATIGFRLPCVATLILCFAGSAAAFGSIVSGEVEIVRHSGEAHSQASPRNDASNVAVWLVPLDTQAQAAAATAPQKPTPQLIQKNKTFHPHVVIVEIGTVVEFPNKDPFFHNIFSLFDGKRFDLGLYESGSTRTVRFDRPGVSFLFCNIHAEMSAIVLAVETPYFSLSDPAGRIGIPDVPQGRYEMHVWYERSLPEDLKEFTREITVAETDRSLGQIRISENPNFTAEHKNKYGQDYVPPPPVGYSRH
jgi:plastocyanin